ncbi:MAG: hypothetical protein HQK54_05895 [Oligoflexales bacterium]|nr:hypothetical protein [Oligoflexales bacterium]
MKRINLQFPDLRQIPAFSGLTTLLLLFPLLHGCGEERQYQNLDSQSRAALPVLTVTKHGVEENEAIKLAQLLKISQTKGLIDANRVMGFVSPDLYQYIPVKTIGEGKPDEDQNATTLQSIDLAALGKITVIDQSRAIGIYTAALKEAGLIPSDILAVASKGSNSSFQAVNTRGTVIAKANLDTHVTLEPSFKEIPIIGPGVKIDATFNGDSQVTQLRLASRGLATGKELAIISADEAQKKCAVQLKSQTPSTEIGSISTRLAYYAPSLKYKAEVLIPHYECSVTGVVNRNNVEFMRMLLPATNDAVYVPSVQIQAKYENGTIYAKAYIKGGKAPYELSWSSSSVYLNLSAEEIKYALKPRSKTTQEILNIKVTDQNGISGYASAAIAIAFSPEELETQPSTGGVRDFGTENSVTSQFGNLEQGFIDEMTGDSVTKRFSWTGNNAWEQDFKREQDTKWVDNTDITFYVGHGSGGGFTFADTTHTDSTLDYDDATSDWGDYDLEWLALLSCQVLTDTWGGMNRFNRWKQEFDGLHLLLGFHTNAYAWSSFSGEFAHNMVRNPFLWWNKPMMVRQAWFDAVSDEQPSGVVAVVMGVMRSDGVSNINDYFWNKGSVGPDIRGSSISGYWTVTGP